MGGHAAHGSLGEPAVGVEVQNVSYAPAAESSHVHASIKGANFSRISLRPRKTWTPRVEGGISSILAALSYEYPSKSTKASAMRSSRGKAFKASCTASRSD